MPNATTFEQPFAGINNVKFADGVKPGPTDISHGELIRDGYDETPTVDLNNLQLLSEDVIRRSTQATRNCPTGWGCCGWFHPPRIPPLLRLRLPPRLRPRFPPHTNWRRGADFEPAPCPTFDDNSRNSFRWRSRCSMPKVFRRRFCIVGNLSTSQWATIESASAKGHEIASHTLTHPSLPTLPDDRVAAELSESKNLIESHTGEEVRVMPILTVRFQGSDHFAVLPVRAELQRIVGSSTPTDFLSIGAMDLVDMNAASDKAAGSGSWLVWLIHGIDNDPACCPITSSVLQSNLDYVAGDTNKWWIETFGNVCRYIRAERVGADGRLERNHQHHPSTDQ